MRQIFIFLFFILTINCFSQDYTDIIVSKSCDCAEKIADTTDVQQYNMKLGICMIEASMPYKKQLKKDYNINLMH